MKLLILPAFVLAILSGRALADAPVCAGEVEIAKAPIVRVERGGVLVLKDGRAVHLEGILLPNAALDRAPPALADRAFDELITLAKGKSLVLHAVWPKEDRYDRVRSQVFSETGTWLQIELLRQGLARVDLAPDRGECNAELYAAEAEARAQHLGLWALPAYAIRSAENVGADAGTFQLVFGKVLDVAVKDGRAFLNFGPDWKTDFTVTISPDDMKTFRRMGVNPLEYQGRLVRVRGIVEQLNGPEIEVGNPKQIELLQ